MKQTVEVTWKIGDERGVPLENLKERKYIFKVPHHWDKDSGWEEKLIIRAAIKELAIEAYNILGILDVKVLKSELKTEGDE